MKRLLEASPVWHAIVWIGIYIATAALGDAISEALGRPNLATAPLMLLLCVVALYLLARNGWLERYGIRMVEIPDLRPALWFVPLAVMACLQYAKGLTDTLDALDVALIIALMIGVGFLEELIFRGFLYKAIRARGGVTRAVVIAGTTFGLGHIVNLLRGFTGVQQLVQVALGIGIGIALCLLFEMTGSILPGVVFHTLLNISGNVSAQDQSRELIAAGAIMLVAVGYAIHLWFQVRSRGAGGHQTPRPSPAGNGSREKTTSSGTSK